MDNVILVALNGFTTRNCSSIFSPSCLSSLYKTVHPARRRMVWLLPHLDTCMVVSSDIRFFECISNGGGVKEVILLFGLWELETLAFVRCSGHFLARMGAGVGVCLFVRGWRRQSFFGLAEKAPTSFVASPSDSDSSKQRLPKPCLHPRALNGARTTAAPSSARRNPAFVPRPYRTAIRFRPKFDE